MGMYDSVMVPCPSCGTTSEFQSKSGDCMLNVYTLENCPQDVLSDVNRHSPNTCDNCNTQFSISLIEQVIQIGRPVIIKKVEDEN